MVFCDFQYSPNRRFLVSAGRDDGLVQLWENNVTGNYQQVQEWNMRRDFGKGTLCIDISVCSKFIVVALSSYMLNRVVLNSVESSEIIRSLTLQPVMKYITKVVFSVDCRVIFIFGHQGNNKFQCHHALASLSRRYTRG